MAMRPLAVAITLVTVAARPAATQDAYRVGWWDAASVLAVGGLSLIPEAAGLPDRRRRKTPIASAGGMRRRCWPSVGCRSFRRPPDCPAARRPARRATPPR